MSHQAPTIPLPGKGEQGQRCNRMACQRENSAHLFNTSTRAWYCEPCARDIEAFAVRVDGNSCFPALAAAPSSKEIHDGY